MSEMELSLLRQRSVEVPSNSRQPGAICTRQWLSAMCAARATGSNSTPICASAKRSRPCSRDSRWPPACARCCCGFASSTSSCPRRSTTKAGAPWSGGCRSTTRCSISSPMPGRVRIQLGAKSGSSARWTLWVLRSPSSGPTCGLLKAAWLMPT